MSDWDFNKNFKGRDRLTRLADFTFEAGMLRRVERTGWAFLGKIRENVAEHSFRTAILGYILADLAGADKAHTAVLCLFHDLHEARTSDFNYVHRRYNQSDRTQALKDCLAGTGLSDDILGLWHELETAETPEAKLAQDADQLDLIGNLKEELDLGNHYAQKWIEAAEQRLRTPQGKDLCRAILATDHKDWWFLGPDKDWWARKNGKHK